MCYFSSGHAQDVLTYFTIKVFLIIWIVFVPIVITARLEKIIKLLQEQNKK